MRKISCQSASALILYLAVVWCVRTSLGLVVVNVTHQGSSPGLAISNPRDGDIVYRGCCTLDFLVGWQSRESSVASTTSVTPSSTSSADGFTPLESGHLVCLLSVQILRLPRKLVSSAMYPYERLQELQPVSRACLLESLVLERGLSIPGVAASPGSSSSSNSSSQTSVWLRKRPHFVPPTLDEINHYHRLPRPRCRAYVERARQVAAEVLGSEADEELLSSIVVDDITEGSRNQCSAQDRLRKVLMLQLRDDRYRSGVVAFLATTTTTTTATTNMSRVDADLGAFQPNRGYPAALRSFVLIRPPKPLPQPRFTERPLAPAAGVTVFRNEAEVQTALAQSSSPSSIHTSGVGVGVGFATLVYSDDYAKGVITLATTLAASLSSSWRAGTGADRGPRELTVMVGCKPGVPGDVNASSSFDQDDEAVLQRLLSYIRADESDTHCAPMVSEPWLRRIRSLGRLLSSPSPKLTRLLRDTTAALREGTSEPGLSSTIDDRPSTVPLSIRIVFVPLLPDLQPGVPLVGLDSGVWMKVHAWALQLQHQRCLVLLDADMMVNGALEHLLRLPGVCHNDTATDMPMVAGASVEQGDLDAGTFNVGLLVLRPSLRVWRDMMAGHLLRLRSKASFQVMETTFLNHYFGGSAPTVKRGAYVLPLNYLCIAETIGRYDEPWRCSTVDFSTCSLSIGGNEPRFKPWLLDRQPPSEPEAVCRGETPPSMRYLAILEAWRTIYRLAMPALDLEVGF